jgi:hypothetical protein
MPYRCPRQYLGFPRCFAIRDYVSITACRGPSDIPLSVTSSVLRSQINRSSLMRVAAFVLVLAVVGCGGSPTAPTPQAPPVPNFQGQWTGDYTVTACTGSADFTAGFCPQFPAGRILPMTLTLNQADRQVNGTLSLGGANVTVTGTVSSGGRLLLNGTATIVVTNAVGQMTLQNWDTAVSGTTMSGSWTSTWTATGSSGAGSTAQMIRVLTKTG